jgi:8-oxo-dGTP pyrophosphatase MutT (NUDIX family)
MPVAATVIVVRDARTGPEVLMMRRPDTGSFAGAWVFPGGKLEPSDGDPSADEEGVARRAGARETLEECGLVLDADDLEPVSVWMPPATIPVRIRTWFFVAPDPGGALVLSPGEVVEAGWFRPGDLLDRHARGELTLFPPTWVTLHSLTDQPDAAGILAVARLGGVQHFETVMREGPDGTMALWRGDAQYDDPDATSGERHRLLTGSLPWSYLREI